MAWKAQTIAGIPEHIYAGPRDAAAGPGIGHLLESRSVEESPYPVAVDRLGWNRCMGPSGPGLLMTVELSPARAVPQDAEVLVWLQYDEASYAEAVLDDYSDADGDLCAAGDALTRDRGVARCAIYLPWAAVPAIKGEVLCQVSVVTEDEVLGNEWFEVSLPGRATREVHSAAGALVFSAVAMVLRSREPGEAERSAALGWIGECFGLDEHGRRSTAGLWERALRQQPDFQKALQLVVDEIGPEDHPEVLRMLGAVARSARTGAREDELFVRRLAQALELPEPPAPPAEDRIALAYRALELDPGAGLEQVRAAYRRLALDYHPDKVEALAVGFREYATARMQAINDAYRLLREHLGGR